MRDLQRQDDAALRHLPEARLRQAPVLGRLSGVLGPGGQMNLSNELAVFLALGGVTLVLTVSFASALICAVREVRSDRD